MRHEILTSKDVQSLIGKFVVQLDINNPDASIATDFHLEKRIRFISKIDNLGYCFNGFYYSFEPCKEQEFIEKWNNPKGRFWRPLNKKELEWLFNKMISQEI